MTKKPRRLIADAALEPFYDGIDQFCTENLPTITEEVSRPHSHKIIADPVEGYSSLDAWEVGIVDTPLFQRMRGIRQLGLAYLVYPTLGYSRFEHVIGVRARLEQVMTVLKHNSILRGDAGMALPTDKQLIRMRLAVLCHDMGHCLFSHVSETVLETLTGTSPYPSAKTIAAAFQQFAGRRIPMAEVFSVSILSSPSFVSFLTSIGIPDAQRRDGAEKIAFDAAHLIMGLPISHDATSLFLGQLMNSGLDIDKLDYMMRESLLSGITLGVSLQWLMKKLFISMLSGDRVPSGLITRLGGFPKDQQFAVLSLERGGQYAFEEFCVARLTLHEKIYLHQKIRAAEAQFRSILIRLAKEVPEYRDVHRWLYLKESILDHPDVDLPGLHKRDLFTQKAPRTARAFNMIQIANRDLLSRAYAFGWQNSIADPLKRDSRDLGVDKLLTMTRESPLDFINDVKGNLKRIADLLTYEIPEKIQILVDPPKLSTIQQGQDSIHIEYPSRLSLRWTMPIDRIEDHYHRNRALGYVFTDRIHLPYVMLAAEKTAWDMCKVLCVQDGLINRHVVEQARDLRTHLDRKGFYDDAVPLRPISDFLAGVEAQSVITTVAERLAAYESRAKKRVSPASVTTFIAQFPADLQPVALAWLEHVEFIRPDTELCILLPRIATDKLTSSMKSMGVSPLGATTDSANHIAYDLRERLVEALPKGIRAPQVPLAEALGMKFDYYLVFDDNTNSGLQALNIVAAWLGKVLPLELKLNEEHVQSLQPELITEFLSKPVCFAFAVAPEGGPERLKKLLVEHLGFKDDLLYCAAQNIIQSRHKIFSGPDSKFQHADKVKLREFVAGVAKTVFMAEKKSEEVAMERCLGDHQAEAMVVFPYNCPTMTIPALWVTGKYGDLQWHPLVERGRRTNPLTGVFSGEDA